MGNVKSKSGIAGKETNNLTLQVSSGEAPEDLFTGFYEIQECFEGECESNLYTHLASCQKNIGHVDFVPVNSFTKHLLPSNYRDDEIFFLIQALGDVTVRIAVNFTSPDRPEFVPGTEDLYPGYNSKDTSSLRTGTGKVSSVYKMTEEMKDFRTCPCPDCELSHTPSRVWWRFEVATSRHVVFDESEAKKSRCRLWFDDKNSPVVNIYGWKMCGSHTERDWCLFNCVSHDVDVGGKLEGMLTRFFSLCKIVKKKYKSRRDVDKLTVIVSHPHGCSKQVSVGRWVLKQGVRYNYTRYTYTTCTCPGSSGALVYRLGCESNHPHSGANSEGLNFSGEWFDY